MIYSLLIILVKNQQAQEIDLTHTSMGAQHQKLGELTRNKSSFNMKPI